MKNAVKWAKKFATPIFVVLIIGFFAIYLRNIDYSAFADLHINWPLLIIASLISLSFRYWGVYIWRTILKGLGAKELPSFTLLSHVYAKAWMGRYIPGSVTWIASKVFMANKLGISKSRLAVSSLLEAGMQIVAMMSISLLILAFDPRLDVISAEIKLVLIIIAVILLVFLYPPVLNRLLGFVYKIIKKKSAGNELHANMRVVVRSFVLYAAATVIMGSAYYFLTLSLYPGTTIDSYFYLVGAFSLAGALGMATPFVPSGLGVRDGAQLVLLSIIMPTEIALVITIFSRLWSAIIDVAFYLVAQAVYRVKKG